MVCGKGDKVVVHVCLSILRELSTHTHTHTHTQLDSEEDFPEEHAGHRGEEFGEFEAHVPY